MIIFPHIPKTAGTVLKNILRSQYGKSHIDSIKVKHSPYTVEDLAFAKKIFKKPQAITGHNLHSPVENLPLTNASYVTVLREPISRCASHYQDLVIRNNLQLSFEEWINIQNNHNLSVRTIAGAPDLEKAKLILKEKFLFVGITEQFEDSLKLFQLLTNEEFGISNKRMIVASSNTIKTTLLKDKESFRLLHEYNELDKELYDFALNEIFKPQLQQYASELRKIELNEENIDKKTALRRRQSIRYNKFIYRQAIKLFR